MEVTPLGYWIQIMQDIALQFSTINKIALHSHEILPIQQGKQSLVTFAETLCLLEHVHRCFDVFICYLYRLSVTYLDLAPLSSTHYITK